MQREQKEDNLADGDNKAAKRTKGRQSSRWMRKVADEVIKNAKRTKGRQSSRWMRK